MIVYGRLSYADLLGDLLQSRSGISPLSEYMDGGFEQALLGGTRFDDEPPFR